ncbi:MAG: hypothetical protein VKP62_16190 [Candidatus Sericytochromatia bacterium]|nr:hypothetical protein [Candidatus Sericytochromatia bacterium]
MITDLSRQEGMGKAQAPLEPLGRRARRQGFPRVWMMAISGLLLAILVMYVHTVIQEARLNRVKQEIDHLREMTIKDRMQLEMVRNPQVIDRKAGWLGMRQPEEVVYIKRPLLVQRHPARDLPPRRPLIREGF